MHSSRWECGIPGKAGTDWEGGVYKVIVEFTQVCFNRISPICVILFLPKPFRLCFVLQEYPTKPPKVKFAKPLFHPNVYPCGKLCLDIINDDSTSKWTAAITLKQVCAHNLTTAWLL